MQKILLIVLFIGIIRDSLLVIIRSSKVRHQSEEIRNCSDQLLIKRSKATLHRTKMDTNMDTKKSSSQSNPSYRLKGATKILSDQNQHSPIDEQTINKTDSNQQIATTNSSLDPSIDSSISIQQQQQFCTDSLMQIQTTTIPATGNCNLMYFTNTNTQPGSVVSQHQHHHSKNQSHQQSNQQQANQINSTSNNTDQSMPPSSSTSTATIESTTKNYSTSIGYAKTSQASFCQHQLVTKQNDLQQSSMRSPQLAPCDIKSLFECPICFDYAVPPIYQCQNGHLVCQGCSSKITHCPTCRVTISDPAIRNLQLDKLANTFQFPCKYNFNGCQWKSYWFKKREHEEVCDYISYSCPCPGTACKWTGLLSQVMPHLSEHHKSITTLNGEDIVFLATDINLKGAVDWVMIQSCFNHHFLLVLEKQELKSGQQQFFAIVQLIGSQKEADKFKYKLELSSNHGGQVKRLQWEATPRSILDGIQVAISSYDCLVFDSRIAQHFLSPMQKDKEAGDGSSQGENLGINVTIDRVIS